METMAVLARHGNVQPSEFATTEWPVLVELGNRVRKMAMDEFEAEQESKGEHTKAIIKSIGEAVKQLAKALGG